MRSSLQASEEATEFHRTEAHSNLGLTKVQYNARRLCSDEKVKETVRINPTA
jgi:hypothetical protein